MLGAMRFVHSLILLLQVLTASVHANDQKEATSSGIGSSSTATECEARTINYITDGLPQFCLTSTWASTITVPRETASSRAVEQDDNVSSINSVNQDGVFPTNVLPGAAEPEETATARFMSFEDWKEMMLRQTGQDPQDLKRRRPSEHDAGERAQPEQINFGLGDEDEISLDFGSPSDGHDSERSTDSRQEANADSIEQDEVGIGLTEDGRPSMYQSNDAGKTCKERFSYSSFDAGATVLKAGPATKNSKAILVENKDTYMLLECAAQNKYVIVELSDDILVDTVVLANFEFFSSMVRHFRVSVSDRYPVKMEKWRELGTFEARNSRDIQPFLVEHPQIWAKYVRVEFLTHYGNEFYCPISLFRVHGSRMLDSWKDIETGREEDATVDDNEGSLQREPPADERSNRPSSVAEPGRDRSSALYGLSEEESGVTCPESASSQFVLFLKSLATCPAPLPTADGDTATRYDRLSANSSREIEEIGTVSVTEDRNRTSPSPLRDLDAHAEPPQPPDAPPISGSLSPSAISSSSGFDNRSDSLVSPTPTSSPLSIDVDTDLSVSVTKTSIPSSASGKNRSSSATGPPIASPTIQEGFFNAITKRLHQVESNLTLSLKYIEDQSRQMQDALMTTEQKQTSKVSHFLDTLNQTVLAELRSVRDQYDQIWQSTVIALDTQRERSERDIVALSTRLNLLADEVVFQKRMAIVQAILLLSCLILVTFARGVSIPSFAPVVDHTTPASYHNATPASFDSRIMENPQDDIRDPEPGRGNSRHGLSYRRNALAGHRDNANNSIGSPGIPSAADMGETLAPVEYHRLSPPLSPIFSEAGITEVVAATSRNFQGTPVRKMASLQQNPSRKPLPALPEHPMPP